MMDGRTRFTIKSESEVLKLAADYGVDIARDAARGCIDGSFNAISRLDGHLRAAEFVFAVTDRIVGNVENKTAFPDRPAPEPKVPAPDPEAVKALPTERRKWDGSLRFWVIFVFGYVVGAVHFAVLLK